MEGVHQKFLDALLGAAKIEHVMAKVEIASEGDLVNEVGCGRCRGLGGSGPLLHQRDSCPAPTERSTVSRRPAHSPTPPQLMILVAGSCSVESPRQASTPASIGEGLDGAPPPALQPAAASLSNIAAASARETLTFMPAPSPGCPTPRRAPGPGRRGEHARRPAAAGAGGAARGERLFLRDARAAGEGPFIPVAAGQGPRGGAVGSGSVAARASPPRRLLLHTRFPVPLADHPHCERVPRAVAAAHRLPRARERVPTVRRAHAGQPDAGGAGGGRGEGEGGAAHSRSSARLSHGAPP
jgi:hypothetical protein